MINKIETFTKDETRLQIMKDLVSQKFSNSKYLQEMLLATGNAILEEGNDWGDTFWVIYNNIGSNHLEKIFLTIRENLRNKL